MEFAPVNFNLDNSKSIQRHLKKFMPYETSWESNNNIANSYNYQQFLDETDLHALSDRTSAALPPAMIIRNFYDKKKLPNHSR